MKGRQTVTADCQKARQRPDSPVSGVSGVCRCANAIGVNALCGPPVLNNCSATARGNALLK